MPSQSVDFVVSDAHLAIGVKILTQFKWLTPCPDSEVCHTSSRERLTQPPAFHFHMEDVEVTVGLYPQSETLWFLPPFDSSFLCPKTLKFSPHFVLASDQTVLPPWRPGRGSGVFKPDQDAVIVPKAHILLEAFMRLYARDSEKRMGAFGLAVIAYVQLYIDNDGLLDVNLLPEPLKTSYKELRQDKKPVRQWLEELKDALGIVEDF